MIDTLAHQLRIGILLMIQPPEWCSENVTKFPVQETLGRFLSDIYIIETVHIDAVNYGLPVGRLRSYTIGRHRMKCMLLEKPISSSFQDFVSLLQRPCNFPWQELWWMHDQSYSHLWETAEKEMNVELTWASSRASVAPVQESDANQHDYQRLRWFKALTETEQDNANIYEIRWPGRAFSLTQSATEHATKSTTKYLQTFIHNFGLLWSWSSNPPRWLTASEALTGMGWPVYPPLMTELGINPTSPRARGFLLTSFDVCRDDRKPQTVRSQCGNSDCLVLAAVVELFCLLNTKTLGCA